MALGEYFVNRRTQDTNVALAGNTRPFVRYGVVTSASFDTVNLQWSVTQRSTYISNRRIKNTMQERQEGRRYRNLCPLS